MIYCKNHIPKSTPYNRRSGIPMTAQYLTIHNTGNASSTAANERAWLTNPSNKREASYHIVIDEKEAIECLPLDEVGWHAGDANGSGNRASIGIELCESGDYAKTLDNAAQLIADMLTNRCWGVDRLRRHYDWSGKICPRLMYDKGSWKGWKQFKAAVAEKLKEGERAPMKLEHNWQWKMLGDALDGLYKKSVSGELKPAVITDYTWVEKAYTRKLTPDELSWLNMIVFARQLGVEA